MRTIFAGFRECAAILTNFLRAQIVNVGIAIVNELDRPLVELIEVVGSVVKTIPLKAQPVDVLHDGVDVLLLFLLRIGIVEAEVRFTAELVG